MIGEVVSHYRITRQLGAGGMGIVYEAVDTKLDRLVALKFLPPELGRDHEAKARLLHEAKAISSLDHPNICTVHEIDETDDGRLFLAMAHYEGETLQERIARGPVPWEEALDIARQVATGLQAAHERGVVHRDVKPANIFVTDAGLVKIMDFGLAKLLGQTQVTQPGVTLGTVCYMSPEQAQGCSADRRSDVWSLGVVLHEMLTGQVPFAGEHAQAVIYAIIHQEPPLASDPQRGMPPELDRVLGKCLAKDAARRYQQADELAADLRQLSGDSGPVPVTRHAFTLRGPGRSKLYWSGVLVLAAAILALGVVSVLMPDGARPDRRSVAVLPFKTIVTDPGYEWFSDGMTEAIVGHLTKIKDLKVTSRTSTSQFRDTSLPIREIADQLGVATILEGSIQQRAGRIHLMVKLIDARTDDHLWAEDYDREFTDVFALQTDIALQVVERLEATLTPEVTERIEAQPTRSLAAYQLVREGLELWGGSFEDRNRGLRKIEQALEIDPDYADAYGKLANFSWLITVYGNRPPREMFPRAKEYALKALELDETNPDAHSTLGFIMSWWERDWAAAERHWQRLLELAPGDAGSYSGYAWLMLQTGRFERAIALHRKAVELSPLSPGYQQNVGEIFYYARRYDEAIAASRETIARFPSYPQTRTILGMAYLGKGMKQEALQALHADLELSQGLKPEVDHYIGAALAAAGDEAGARTVLSRMLARYEQGWASLVSIAEIYLALGKEETALAYLQKADEERDPRLSWLKISPSFDPVRDDPRFAALLKKVGLAP